MHFLDARVNCLQDETLRSVALWRTCESRDAVISTAGRILQADGYSGLTMERVAAESGVAKTTVHRRWPSKAALCMDLYLDISERELKMPDAGTIEGDLRQIARAVVHEQTKPWRGRHSSA